VPRAVRLGQTNPETGVPDLLTWETHTPEEWAVPPPPTLWGRFRRFMSELFRSHPYIDPTVTLPREWCQDANANADAPVPFSALTADQWRGHAHANMRLACQPDINQRVRSIFYRTALRCARDMHAEDV